MIECDFCDYRQDDNSPDFRLFFNVDGMDCCEVCYEEKMKEK